MRQFDIPELKKLFQPAPDSHKGQNGKLMVIGGSHLFHAASLWSLEIASKMVDMVFYSSVPENNKIVQEAKSAFRNGIIIPREFIESYLDESDCILIGPGMVRAQHRILFSKSKKEIPMPNLTEINKIKDEGEQTYVLTKYLLQKYPHKKWIIDAGSLQMMKKEWLEKMMGNVVLTPHQGEFQQLFHVPASEKNAQFMAKKFNCVILLKGHTDIVCSPIECVRISGGNAGMTKGGTGDVLAGLVAALACKNDIFLAAAVGSYINKKAGESLFKKVGLYFNASDLVNEIPMVMKQLL